MLLWGLVSLIIVYYILILSSLTIGWPEDKGGNEY